MMERKLPTREQLEGEKRRLEKKRSFRHSLATTLCFIIAAAAAAVLLSTLVFPIYTISGSSMEPTLSAGDVVLCLRQPEYANGQICSFAYGNKLLMKRIIGSSGDVLEIDSAGRVRVQNSALEEPYAMYGQDTGEEPQQTTVLGEKYFFMGDNRQESIDSRNEEIGMISKHDVTARALLRIWPIEKFGLIE